MIRELQILQVVTRFGILSQCRGKIPTIVFTVDKLKSDLLVLDQSMTNDGYELAISASEVLK